MDMLKELLVTAFPIVVTSLCGYIVWMLQQDRKERKANSQGTKEILGYMIDRIYDEVSIQEYITTEQSNRLEALFSSYSDLHGNGTRKHKYEVMKKMPIADSMGAVNPFFVMYRDFLKGSEDNNE